MAAVSVKRSIGSPSSPNYGRTGHIFQQESPLGILTGHSDPPHP